jgi:type II secretory pathway pseudopilin PulG
LVIGRLMFLCGRQRGIRVRGEIGTSLIETLVALALLGIIGVSFLGALAMTSNARATSDEHNSAGLLAESQMDHIKRQGYAASYDPLPIPDEYEGYSTQIEVDNLRNGNIQKITITVSHRVRDITTLESYKTNR